MVSTCVHWIRAHKRFLIMTGISISIWFAFMIVTNYFSSILKLDNQDLSEAYFGIKSQTTIDIGQEKLLDQLNNCTLMQYDPDNPMEHIVLFTSGKKDLFEGKYFDMDNFYHIPSTIWYGNQVSMDIPSKDDGVLLQKYNNFMVDYGSFLCKYELTNIPTDKILHMVSYDNQSLKKALKAIKGYCYILGVSYEQLDLEIVKTSNFLNKYKWTYLIFFCIFTCLLAIDIGNFYMYISASKKGRKVYYLLGINGYQKHILMQIIYLKSAMLLSSILWSLATEYSMKILMIIVLLNVLELLIIVEMVRRVLHYR